MARQRRECYLIGPDENRLTLADALKRAAEAHANPTKFTEYLSGETGIKKGTIYARMYGIGSGQAPQVPRNVEEIGRMVAPLGYASDQIIIEPSHSVIRHPNTIDDATVRMVCDIALEDGQTHLTTTFARNRAGVNCNSDYLEQLLARARELDTRYAALSYNKQAQTRGQTAAWTDEEVMIVSQAIAPFMRNGRLYHHREAREAAREQLQAAGYSNHTRPGQLGYGISRARDYHKPEGYSGPQIRHLSLSADELSTMLGLLTELGDNETTRQGLADLLDRDIEIINTAVVGEQQCFITEKVGEGLSYADIVKMYRAHFGANPDFDFLSAARRTFLKNSEKDSLRGIARQISTLIQGNFELVARPYSQSTGARRGFAFEQLCELAVRLAKPDAYVIDQYCLTVERDSNRRIIHTTDIVDLVADKAVYEVKIGRADPHEVLEQVKAQKAALDRFLETRSSRHLTPDSRFYLVVSETEHPTTQKLQELVDGIDWLTLFPVDRLFGDFITTAFTDISGIITEQVRELGRRYGEYSDMWEEIGRNMVAHMTFLPMTTDKLDRVFPHTLDILRSRLLPKSNLAVIEDVAYLINAFLRTTRPYDVVSKQVREYQIREMHTYTQKLMRKFRQKYGRRCREFGRELRNLWNDETNFFLTSQHFCYIVQLHDMLRYLENAVVALPSREEICDHFRRKGFLDNPEELLAQKSHTICRYETSRGYVRTIPRVYAAKHEKLRMIWTNILGEPAESFRYDIKTLTMIRDRLAERSKEPQTWAERLDHLVYGLQLIQQNSRLPYFHGLMERWGVSEDSKIWPTDYFVATYTLREKVLPCPLFTIQKRHIRRNLKLALQALDALPRNSIYTRAKLNISGIWYSLLNTLDIPLLKQHLYRLPWDVKQLFRVGFTALRTTFSSHQDLGKDLDILEEHLDKVRRTMRDTPTGDIHDLERARERVHSSNRSEKAKSITSRVIGFEYCDRRMLFKKCKIERAYNALDTARAFARRIGEPLALSYLSADSQDDFITSFIAAAKDLLGNTNRLREFEASPNQVQFLEELVTKTTI